MNYRDLARKLESLGCREAHRRRGRGSHRKWINDATGDITVIPDWGRRDLKTGTIRAVVRNLGLNWDEFRSRS